MVDSAVSIYISRKFLIEGMSVNTTKQYNASKNSTMHKRIVMTRSLRFFFFLDFLGCFASTYSSGKVSAVLSYARERLRSEGVESKSLMKHRLL